MKIKYAFWGMISMIILLTACGSMVEGSNGIVLEKSNLKEESSDMETKVDMTPEQEALLCKISINEDRVKEGKLFVWQEEVLRQYDYAMDYLLGKYPSYTFHIVDCEPKNKLNNAYSKFVFQESDDSESYYDLYLYVEDGEYSAEDNFYGYIIEEEYENELKAVLLQEDIPCDRVDARITTVEGNDFNEKLEVSDIINGNVHVQNTTFIYIDSNRLGNESYKEEFEKIKQVINQKKVSGYYIVSIYDSVNENKEVFNEAF